MRGPMNVKYMKMAYIEGVRLPVTLFSFLGWILQNECRGLALNLGLRMRTTSLSQQDTPARIL
jgi:hypothetical protein